MSYLEILKKASYIAIKAAISYFAPNAASKFISIDNLISPVAKEATHNIAEKYVEKQALESLEFMAAAIAPDVLDVLKEYLSPKVIEIFEPSPKDELVSPQELTIQD